jgi:tRNA-dihydrouridine synthase B
MPALTDPWTLGGLEIPNRVALAPLAGIGNWFVRLQARRHGAGLVVSEMVSSFAIHYENTRTCTELLRIHPDERAGGPVSIQLFGSDPDVMRSAAATVAAAGADLIDLNMGCPVPKVCKTGAGAALISDPELAVGLARAAREGSGLPVTVKIRSGQRPGDRHGLTLARRLVDEAGVAAIAFHPRSAAVGHAGHPDHEMSAELVRTLDAPVILTGGMRTPAAVQSAFEQTGAAAVMLARGALGNPWLFEQVLGLRELDPTPGEVLGELDWVIDSAVEHLGQDRAARYLRKFYPWYLARLPTTPAIADALARSASIDDARQLLADVAGTVSGTLAATVAATVAGIVSSPVAGGRVRLSQAGSPRYTPASARVAPAGTMAAGQSSHDTD